MECNAKFTRILRINMSRKSTLSTARPPGAHGRSVSSTVAGTVRSTGFGWSVKAPYDRVI